MGAQDKGRTAAEVVGDFEHLGRQLPESCVEYMLFVMDGALETRKTLANLEKVKKAALKLCEHLTNEYIWQRDAFNLELKTENGLVYLHGITDFGDSIEDEWLIVYMLRGLSKSFKDLWIRVADADGEFLLVEAANVLPKWLSPEIDANRVWIHDGKLRIIPLGECGKPSTRLLSLGDAVAVLKAAPDSPIHSAFVEAEAFYRLEKYPAQIAGSLHHSLATIPRKLAHILHDRPATVAPAVEAFYLRDPAALRPLLSDPPSATLAFPPADLTTVSVRFTRTLFAQLRSQRFPAPPPWRPVLQPLELEAAGAAGAAGADDDDKPAPPPAAQAVLSRAELGMKLTTGFELLARRADAHRGRAVREMALVLADLAEDGGAGLPDEAAVRAWPGVDRDDDDGWLDVDFRDLERELAGVEDKKKQKKQDKSGAGGEEAPGGRGFGDAGAQADLQKIVSRFEAFLNDEQAGVEGAELDEMDEDDDDEDEDEDGEWADENEDREVSFDEAEFARMMREMMGLPASETVSSRGVKDDKAKTGAQATVTMKDATAADDSEEEDIQRLMGQMETELKEHGALTLDPTPKPKALKGNDTAVSPSAKRAANGQEEESEDDEVDIDYNLAKNLLESFKSQGGLAGPAGNMLNMMGMQLPRDDDEETSK